MKTILFLTCFFPLWAVAQSNVTRSVDSRIIVSGASSEMRVEIVQDAEILIKDLDRLAGDLKGKPFPISLRIYPRVQGKPSQIVREFLIAEGLASKYELNANLRLGPGDSFDQAKLDRILLELLLIERTLRSQPPEVTVERVEIRPWLLDGIGEALLWRKDQGERAMYASLMESGGWVEVEKLVDRTTVKDLNTLSRELFRASSGALVMALLSQPQGDVSMTNYLARVAAFEGEPLTLLRTHFPQANLGAKSLERWWMLQVASMSEQKLSQAMTVPETEEQLVKILELHLRDEQGKAMRLPLTSWAVVAELETKAERLEAVRPASDLLAHLSFRCFPTYRPIIGRYILALSEIVAGETKEISTALENLRTFRAAENARHTQLINLMNWYHLSSVREESGKFEDYLRVKESLRLGDDETKDDPINRYLNQVEALFSESAR